MSTSGTSGWVGIDFDGTLAVYGGFKGHDDLGEPVPAMVAKVKELLARGIEVRIFTARVSDPNARERVILALEEWCLRHIGQKLRVTNEKDHTMWCLYDDRCVAVERNTGRVLGGEEP